jgi:uncharacterized protein YhbP (UPF0306 family)
MLIPSPPHGIFQIAMLVEEKQRMVAIAGKVAVVSGTLLLAMRFTLILQGYQHDSYSKMTSSYGEYGIIMVYPIRFPKSNRLINQ